MAEQTVADVVGYLARGFPRQPIDRDQYIRELADVPVGVLAAAVQQSLRTPGEWVPSVGDIRARCAEQMLGLPSEREAAQQVDGRIRWGRAKDGEPPTVHPLVREAVDHVGGWHSIRSSDRPEVVRGQMLRFYREARDAEIRSAASRDMGVAPVTPA